MARPVYSVNLLALELSGTETNFAAVGFVTVIREVSVYIPPPGGPVTASITVGPIGVFSVTSPGAVAELYHEDRRIVLEPQQGWTVESTDTVQWYISGYLLTLP